MTNNTKITELDERELDTVTGGVSLSDVEFAPYQPQYNGGVRVASGDIDGDGTSDIELERVQVTSYQLGVID